MNHFFILGEHPQISLAEIISWFAKEQQHLEIVLFHKNILIVETLTALNAASLMRQLGGAIKIGTVLKKIDAEGTASAAREVADLVSVKTKADKKTYFGLSFYAPLSFSLKPLTLGLEIKKILTTAGRKVRLVTSREPVLSSVVVETNKLLGQQGLEVVLLVKDSEIWLGYTLAVQPFRELGARDYGRPARDAAAGMLPPKLAKILINLARITEKQALLDPFCGSGTILTEGWLMGYSNILGSDNSELAISNTRRNIAWIATCKGAPCDCKGHPCKIAAPKIQLKKCDVRMLSRCWPAQSVDAIVTEPWLGPPLTGREPPEKIKNIINELGQLYLSAFNQFKKVLVPGGKAVFVLPAFRRRNEWQFLPILDKITALGFKPESEPLLYARPDQKVGRQIVKFSLFP